MFAFIMFKVSQFLQSSIMNTKRRSIGRRDSFMRKFSTMQSDEHSSENKCESSNKKEKQVSNSTAIKPLSQEKTETAEQKQQVTTVPATQANSVSVKKPTETQEKVKKLRFWQSVIKPKGNFMFVWLGFVSLTVLYNIWTAITRQAFRNITDGFFFIWLPIDLTADCILLFDILVQSRTAYYEKGLLVLDHIKTAKVYVKTRSFKLDLISLLPLELLQIKFGIHPILRFPRFLKVYRALQWKQMVESRTAYPNLLRILHFTHIIFLGAHWFAGFYYLISEWEGFTTAWGYPKPEGEYAAGIRKYLMSLYWAMLTLTTIGDGDTPKTELECAINNSLLSTF